MTRDPFVLDPEMPLKAAAQVLFRAQVSGAPVVAADGELVGVVSERDLLAKEASARFGFGRKATQEERRREARTVGEACTRPALTTVPGARLSEAASQMLQRDVSRLVVLDEGRVAGIVTRHDVLAALVRDDADLRAAVLDMLAERDESDVEVAVDGGEVRLSGTTRLRSAGHGVSEAVTAVDGVIAALIPFEEKC